MTIHNPPLHLQNASHSAVGDRQLTEALFNDRPGTLSSADLTVIERGAGANMSVDVVAGSAVINGTESPTTQSMYFVHNTATVNLAIGASDPTNTRYDLVVATVKDAAYSGSDNEWELNIVEGTPAASPVFPSVPANSIVLAYVTVAALDTAITDSEITDTRAVQATQGTTVGQLGYATLNGGQIVCTSASRPASPKIGWLIYETDTEKGYRYNGTAWKFINNDDMGIWQSFTPSNTNVSASNNAGKYCRVGDIVHFHISITLNGTTGSGAFLVGLPVIAASGIRNTYLINGMALAYDASAVGRMASSLKIESSGTQISFWRQDWNAFLAESVWTETTNSGFAWASGDVVEITGSYEV